MRRHPRRAAVRESSVTAVAKSDVPWLVMALAEPITDALTQSPLREIVEAIRDISITLAAMHARGISHRDLKPDNLFKTHGVWSVGDFRLRGLRRQGGADTGGRESRPRTLHRARNAEHSRDSRWTARRRLLARQDALGSGHGTTVSRARPL